MSDKHEGCVRGFRIRSESWYGRFLNSVGCCEEIMIGMYADDDRGGTSGEFAIRWLHVGGRQVPRLEVFDDGWNALTRFDDLLKWLASVDCRKVTPRQVADALVSMGVKDMTQRDDPNGR